MTVYFGADHRGFELKESLKKFVKNMGYEVEDLGARERKPDDDYPDYGTLVAEKVNKDPDNTRGVLICGSGVGMDVVANRYKNVRSALATLTDLAYDARHDDDANVLTLAANFTNEEDAKNIVKVFFTTPFDGNLRYRRRLMKVENIAGNQ